MAGLEHGDPRAEDAYLFAERGDLADRDVSLGNQSHPSDAAVGAPAADMGKREARERDGVQHRALRVLAPLARKRDIYRARGGSVRSYPRRMRASESDRPHLKRAAIQATLTRAFTGVKPTGSLTTEI